MPCVCLIEIVKEIVFVLNWKESKKNVQNVDQLNQQIESDLSARNNLYPDWWWPCQHGPADQCHYCRPSFAALWNHHANRQSQRHSTGGAVETGKIAPVHFGQQRLVRSTIRSQLSPFSVFARLFSWVFFSFLDVCLFIWRFDGFIFFSKKVLISVAQNLHLIQFGLLTVSVDRLVLTWPTDRTHWLAGWKSPCRVDSKQKPARSVSLVRCCPYPLCWLSMVSWLVVAFKPIWLD